MNPNKMLIETWMSDPTVTSTVYNFAQFVGFYTAHVVWYLEGLDGENVSPLLAVQKAGEAWIEHFESTA